jgi:hypothetical protein
MDVRAEYDWEDQEVYTVARSFLFFSIPSGVTISQAKLVLTSSGSGSGSPVIHAQQGTQADPVIAGDFDAITGSSFGSVSPTNFTGGSSFDMTLNSTGISYLNSVAGSVAKIVLREAQDINNSTPDDYVAWLPLSQNATTENHRPKLVITYTE